MRCCRPFWIGHSKENCESEANAKYRHLTFHPLPVRGGEEIRRPRLQRRIMIMALKNAVCFLLLGGCLLSSGCVAPHYTNHQFVIFGKAAPAVAGPDIPAIQKNLSVTPGPKVDLLTVVTGFATTPLKCLGLHGW